MPFKLNPSNDILLNPSRLRHVVSPHEFSHGRFDVDDDDDDDCDLIMHVYRLMSLEPGIPQSLN